MSSEDSKVSTINESVNSSEQRFAQNIVAETTTILLAIVFGLASSMLIVRGLPKSPVYEFYFYILVFTWIGVLLPFGIAGINVAVIKHIPEILSQRNASVQRVMVVTLLVSILVSCLVIVGFSAIRLLPPFSSVLLPELIPFLQLALLTVPLTAISTVMQAFFRGVQEMRFCTYAMSIYHSLYFVGLAFFFLFGAMTLFSVIWLNIGVSLITIGFEVIIVIKLIGKYRKIPIKAEPKFSRRQMVSTSVYALLLAILTSVFLYVPLLIADIFRTSDIILAGLGLALSVAYYVHQGQAAPFHVLTPRTSEEVARDSLPAVTRFVGQAWKFGLLFNGFVVVGVLGYAVPVLAVLFAGEGLVAAPFLILLAGSFAIYPLITMIMDTLVGLGRLRKVLLTYAVWTVIVVLALLVFSPIGHEVVVSLMWIVGIPFLLIFLFLYQRHTQTQLNVEFLPRGLLMLAGLALVAFIILFTGSIVIAAFGLVGFFAVSLQVGIILTLIPLFYVYLWGLVKIRVLHAEDLKALLSISQVLHPISRPVTWLIKQLE